MSALEDGIAPEQPANAGCGAVPCWPLEYQPETWAMLKDTIYAARSALEAGLENTQEMLIQHDASLGRTTRGNRYTAERLEREIRAMQSALEKLRHPDGVFPANDPAQARRPADGNQTDG